MTNGVRNRFPEQCIKEFSYMDVPYNLNSQPSSKCCFIRVQILNSNSNRMNKKITLAYTTV